jgi:hypothetical protein
VLDSAYLSTKNVYHRKLQCNYLEVDCGGAGGGGGGGK